MTQAKKKNQSVKKPSFEMSDSQDRIKIWNVGNLDMKFSSISILYAFICLVDEVMKKTLLENLSAFNGSCCQSANRINDLIKYS